MKHEHELTAWKLKQLSLVETEPLNSAAEWERRHLEANLVICVLTELHSAAALHDKGPATLFRYCFAVGKNM